MIDANTVTALAEQLSNDALNWAVAKAEGYKYRIEDGCVIYTNLGEDLPAEAVAFSESWAIVGPIIDRERIGIERHCYLNQGVKYEDALAKIKSADFMDEKTLATSWGVSPIEAAMRCYVKLKLGTRIEIPNILFIKKAPKP